MAMEFRGLLFWLASFTYLTVGVEGIAKGYDGIFWHNFLRSQWQSSLVVGDHLYIDGGELSTGTFYVERYYGSTVRINLATSWTNKTVTAEVTNKPLHYPYSRAPLLWSDGSNLYSYGGLRYYFRTCYRVEACGPPVVYGNGKPVHPYFLNNSDPHSAFENRSLIDQLIRVPNQIWKLPLHDFPHSSWSSQSLGLPKELAAQGAIPATYDSTFYTFGGFKGLPYGNQDYNPVKPISGLSSWSSKAGWRHQAGDALLSNANAAMGVGVAAPFGAQGVIVYIGGYAPSETKRRFPYASFNSPLRDMSQIVVYDIATRQLISQNATGDIPGARWAFCGVGASEINSGTFDIFIFGGFQHTTLAAPDVSSLRKVYVLSLPEFIWTEVPDSTQSSMRGSPSCQLIGRSQFLIIGGSNPTANQDSLFPDPWHNSLGIFDLNTWMWASQYDANAAPYKRAPQLVALYNSMRYPHTWNSPAVRNLFKNTTWDYAMATQNSTGTNIGAIAGGVVGGVVGVVLIGLIAFFIRRRKIKRNVWDRTPPGIAEADFAAYKRAAELEPRELPRELPAEKKPQELGPAHAWELAGSDRHSSIPSSDDTRTIDDEKTLIEQRHEMEG